MLKVWLTGYISLTCWSWILGIGLTGTLVPSHSPQDLQEHWPLLQKNTLPLEKLSLCKIAWSDGCVTSITIGAQCLSSSLTSLHSLYLQIVVGRHQVCMTSAIYSASHKHLHNMFLVWIADQYVILNLTNQNSAKDIHNHNTEWYFPFLRTPGSRGVSPSWGRGGWGWLGGGLGVGLSIMWVSGDHQEMQSQLHPILKICSWVMNLSDSSNTKKGLHGPIHHMLQFV